MAKVKIQGHASGTGILTVTAPNTSTDRTITLPDATGTLLNSDGDGSSLTGVGGVVVSYKIVTINPDSSGISTTSTTYVEADSTLRIAHAMAASGNKLIFNLFTLDNYANAAKTYIAVTNLTDVTTNIMTVDRPLIYIKSALGTEPYSNFGMQEYSPGTTSSITYCVSFKNGGSGTAYLNNAGISDGQVRFSLMEIAV